jgi:hypothetical protein
MNVALIGTGTAVGVPGTSRISVTDQREAPLLAVSAVLPSRDSARPNGFGACTLTSAPAGVTKRPLGRMAPFLPSMMVDSAVG